MSSTLFMLDHCFTFYEATGTRSLIQYTTVVLLAMILDHVGVLLPLKRGCRQQIRLLANTVNWSSHSRQTFRIR